MSGKSRMKEGVQNIGRFGTAPYWQHHALSLWAMVAALALADAFVHAGESSAEPACDHFLYLRHDHEGGMGTSDSLVLVRVTHDGFDARPVYSKRMLNIDWNPLGIRNGKLYAIRMCALMAVNLHTGTAEQVDSGIQSWKWRDGKLYAFVQQGSSHQASLLRVYDAETEAFRDIGVPPHPPENIYWPGWPPEIEVSPDHKWVANFCRSTNVIHWYLHQLRLIGVDDGSVKTSEISVAAREFLGGSDLHSESRPPFCWLDSRTLLVVRDVSTNRYPVAQDGDEGMADMILSSVDIVADRMTDICALPRFRPNPGEPFFRIVRKGEAPRLVISRLGQYRIDLEGRRLIPDPDIGGGYICTRSNADDKPDTLRFNGELVEDKFVIREIVVSPDGTRTVWRGHLPMSDAYASEIRIHDTVSGTARTVAREWIPEGLSSGGTLVWTSSNELTPRGQTNVPAGWTRFSPRPYSE